VAVVKALRHRAHARSGHAFGCPYTQRTLGQLGEEALKLPLVARHLLLCPACRAHRRRVSRVDEALKNDLLTETPPFFSGRWEEINARIAPPTRPRPQRFHRRREERRGFVTGALASLAFLVASAWLVDHHPERVVDVIATGPGVSVTELTVEGEKATVAIESADEDEGAALYLWLESDTGEAEPLRDPR